MAHDPVEAALRANAQALLAFCERRLGAADGADALAEVMTVAWRRSGDLPGEAEEARMWLFGVARGVIANAARGELRRSRLAARLRSVTVSQARTPSPPSDEALAVRDAIERLPGDLAEVVRLVHWDGFTLAEVARLMEQPGSTVRSRYARAREELRAALDGGEARATHPTTS